MRISSWIGFTKHRKYTDCIQKWKKFVSFLLTIRSRLLLSLQCCLHFYFIFDDRCIETFKIMPIFLLDDMDHCNYKEPVK